MNDTTVDNMGWFIEQLEAQLRFLHSQEEMYIQFPELHDKWRTMIDDVEDRIKAIVEEREKSECSDI